MAKRKRKAQAPAGGPSALPLRLSVTAASGVALVSYLRRHIGAAHALLKKPPLAELSIALVGDRRMAELHEQFLGIPGPTDVLTFPLELDRRGRPLSGEVVICVPEARRRGVAEGTGLRREALLYALHGLLHLCGFDDRTRAGYAAMHRTEDAILTTLGIGPVFSAGDRSGAEKSENPRANRSVSRETRGSGRGLKKAASPRMPLEGKQPQTPLNARAAGALSRKPSRSKEKHRRSSPDGVARRVSRRAD